MIRKILLPVSSVCFFLASSLSHATIYYIRDTVESPLLVDRTTPDVPFLLSNIQETVLSGSGTGYYQADTGVLTFSFISNGSADIDGAGGAQVFWTTNEAITIHSFDSSDTGLRQVVSCSSSTSGTASGLDVCPLLSQSSNFGLTSFSLDMGSRGIKGFELTGNTNIFTGDNTGSTRITYYAPVPTASWLFGSALMGLGVIRRRKQ